MKGKYFIVLILLSLVLASTITCGNESIQTPSSEISPDIERQIYAIIDEPSSKYISISSIEDDGSLCRINIEFLFEPDSYSEVRIWTDAVCYETYDIFKRAGIERSISIWARRTLTGDRVALYGRTFYSRHTGKYEFQNIKELNL